MNNIFNKSCGLKREVYVFVQRALENIFEFPYWLYTAGFVQLMTYSLAIQLAQFDRNLCQRVYITNH